MASDELKAKAEKYYDLQREADDIMDEIWEEDELFGDEVLEHVNQGLHRMIGG